MRKLLEDIEEIEDKIDYCFDNPDLLVQAFTLKDYASKHGLKSYDDFVLIGDCSISYCLMKLASTLFGYFDSYSDKFDPENDRNQFEIMANTKYGNYASIYSKILSPVNLAYVLDKLGFDKYILTERPITKIKKKDLVQIKANVLEAIIGAACVDCKFHQQYIEAMIATIFKLNNLFESFYMSIDNKKLDHIIDEDELGDELRVENSLATLDEYAKKGYCSTPDIQVMQVEEKGQIKYHCTCYVKSWGIKKECTATTELFAMQYAAHKVLCERMQLQETYSQVNKSSNSSK